MIEINDKNIQFLLLYFTAYAISVTSCYAHFYFSSVLVPKGGLKNAVLVLMSGIFFVIFSIFLPMELIRIGLHLINAWERNEDLPFLAYFVWIFPLLMITIKKYREFKNSLNKRKDVNKSNA